MSTLELNFAVQRTIDRIIFLRICEDRGIEDYGTLQTLENGRNIYARLFEVFERADARYNSGLFHFHKEKDRPELPDEISARLKIDDKVFKEIFRELYYPESPYEFSVLPVEILGQVYEQFLGQVIHLTDGHHAKIEEKPEVKKPVAFITRPSISWNTLSRIPLGSCWRERPLSRRPDCACLTRRAARGRFSLARISIF